MVAGVIKFYLKRESIDEAVEYWNATIAIGKKHDPHLREKLNGYFLLVDHKTGHGYSIGIWNTAADSKTFQQSHFYIQKVAELEAFCMKPITREEFDIDGGNLDFSLLDKLAA